MKRAGVCLHLAFIIFMYAWSEELLRLFPEYEQI